MTLPQLRHCSDRLLCGRRCGLDAPGPWVLTPMYCPYVERPVAMVDVPRSNIPQSVNSDDGGITRAELLRQDLDLRRQDCEARNAAIDERADRRNESGNER